MPYRETVYGAIEKAIKDGQQVFHISVHSFTPVLNQQIRNNDIGLLYDPQRKQEAQFCKTWKTNLAKQTTPLRVRMNYPYLGISDGLTSYLRKKYSSKQYMGLELEMNQKHFQRNKAEINIFIATLQNSLIKTLEQEKAC